MSRNNNVLATRGKAARAGSNAQVSIAAASYLHIRQTQSHITAHLQMCFWYFLVPLEETVAECSANRVCLLVAAEQVVNRWL